MTQSDAQHSAFTVVFKDLPDEQIPQAIEQLRTLGMQIDDADESLGVVEGEATSQILDTIRGLSFVQYVRVEMSYLADYPPEDPRNTEKPAT